MEIEVRTDGARAVLVLRSKGIDDLDCQRFRDVIDRVLRGGYQDVVLDLQGVAYLDSAFLAEIVRAQVAIQRQEGVLTVANATQRIHDLLTIIQSHIPKLFDPPSRAPDVRSNGALWVALSILLVIVVMVAWRLAGLFHVP